MAVKDVFSEITPEPVAAASLGQVYRARLRGSTEEVAVKVQRPGVKDTISKDVFILRLICAYVREASPAADVPCLRCAVLHMIHPPNRPLLQAKSLNSDLPAILDEWAGSLFKVTRFTHRRTLSP